MRRSTSLLVAAIALAVTTLAIRSYLRLKEKYPNPVRSIRKTLYEMNGYDCEVERDGLPGPTDRDEEYRILSMLLRERTRSSGRLDSMIVISEEIDTGRGMVGTPGHPKCRETEAWADLAWKDRNCRFHGKDFRLGVPFVLLGPGEEKAIFRDGEGWTGFYERFPDSQGIWSLSRVGFSRRGDIAIVRIGCQAHLLSGYGSTLVLVRTREGWEVRGWRIRWVS